jgi:hypothetical protein
MIPPAWPESCIDRLRMFARLIKELTNVARAIGTLVKELAPVGLMIVGLLEWILRHWPK